MIQKNTDLRQLIKSQHIPQTKLALALNISPTTLMRWLDLTVTEEKRVMILAAIAKVAGRCTKPCETPKAKRPRRKMVFSVDLYCADKKRVGFDSKQIEESRKMYTIYDQMEVEMVFDSAHGRIKGTEIQIQAKWCEEGF